MISDPPELPLRRRIYQYIKTNPGVHFRRMQRDLDLAVGQLDFHLNALMKKEAITKQVEGGNARYYVRDKFTPQERKAMSSLRREIPRGIVLFLLERPGSSPTDIRKRFTFTGATMSYHLRKLEKAGILRAETHGRVRNYFVAEPEMAEMLLVMYRATLVDTIVDRVA